MTDDNDKNLTLTTEKSGVAEFLDSFNLPKFLAGNTGKAISDLIGGAVAIPAAKLDQYAQGIKDNTKAKSIVSDAIAQKTADVAVKDPELLERAKENFVNDLIRKQSNKEKVAVIAAQVIDKEEIPEDTPNIDDDWMNVFSSHVENASSERMQDIWGKVLSGEIRRPSEFSISTLRFLSELDKDTAEAFEKIAGYNLSGVLHEKIAEDRDLFQSIMVLNENGLLNTGTGLGLEQTINIKPFQTSNLFGESLVLSIEAGENPISFKFGIIKFTRIGNDLLKVLRVPTESDAIDFYSDEWSKLGAKKVYISSIQSGQGAQKKFKYKKTLWNR